ncbi:hypothetical protein G3260_006369 [Streptomyces albus]|uniref:Uncharacterized protein n=1 Tax=Streptomyces albus TaxID=1888 RepID=A0A6C1C8Y1_9ACTN|nr:hypothetical protein HMPREF1486_04548 [Streptomyces sp. HPH0547]KPC92661.1 hypothetical protein ADL27_23510 [Streptomyces sp. NRRL F-6602]QID39498.1 hypothetical protein G3260_006369 [Streptomyces albus]TGG86233.1 hypothetical protein D8771_07555 [Streptomyces albus]
MSSGETTTRPVAEELVLLAAYLLSCGRGLLEEPQAYGPLRCLDAGRRVLTLVEQAGLHDERLSAVRARLDDCMCGPMEYRDLPGFLDEVCGSLITALKDSELISASTGHQE